VRSREDSARQVRVSASQLSTVIAAERTLQLEWIQQNDKATDAVPWIFFRPGIV